MDKYIDYWNLMGYDFVGSWSGNQTAGHSSNLYPSGDSPASTPFSVDAAVEYHIITGGIRSSKLILGMPLFGRDFHNTDGPGKHFKGVGNGTWDVGTYDYKVLPQKGAVPRFMKEIGASYSYDSKQRIMMSYESLETIRAKAEYVKLKNLGGAMWWEASSDRKGDQSLIRTVSAPTFILKSKRNFAQPNVIVCGKC